MPSSFSNVGESSKDRYERAGKNSLTMIYVTLMAIRPSSRAQFNFGMATAETSINGLIDGMPGGPAGMKATKRRRRSLFDCERASEVIQPRVADTVRSRGGLS